MSFVGGFDSSIEFFDVLPRMVALHTLHLTHLPLLQAAAPSRSITLNALRHLKLSQCAVYTLSSTVVNLRFPEVKHISLLMTEAHLHHMAEVCLDKTVSADMAEPLCRMLERSGAVIGILDIDLEPFIPSAFVAQLCAKLDATVHTLRVKFSFGYRQQELTAFLDLLTVRPNAKPSFPRLVELQLVGLNQILGQEQLFKGPALETLVVSRWSDSNDASTRLRTLRLRRARFQPEPNMNYEHPSDFLAK
ncbi:hypothetical protein CPB85DRAFT_190256 [Mucidula mucida]|nr:hypothetical protein CPB85DRAFT_190256 [Mucidula mucida]